MRQRLALLVCMCISFASSLPYNRSGAVAYAQAWQNFKKYGHHGNIDHFREGGNCCKFVSRDMRRGGFLKFWGVKDSIRKTGACSRQFTYESDRTKYLGHLDENGDFSSIGELKVCLQEWGVPIQRYSARSLRTTIPPALNIGDLVIVDNETHILIVTGIDWALKKIRVTDHHGSLNWDKKHKKWVGKTDFFCNRELVDYLQNYLGQSSCRIVHMPSVIKNCMDLKQYESNDSTVGHRPDRYHGIHCCWHENIGGTWPWTDNPTPYACLSWSEPGRTTKDSLILPRINLAACSSAVAVWACTTNLYSWGTRVAQVLGSTDDGVTWDTLGDNTLDSVDMPWATNQRKVRLAFVYTGAIMKDTFWCIDHFRVIARPTRDTDISVSQIKVPGGHGTDSLPLTIPGQTIVPEAFVWNCGKHDESVLFTFEIDGGSTYIDTVRLNLFPYLDTCVRFAPWTVTTGSHTAVCYASLPGDECLANDTVTQNFLAVGDTWAQLSKIYGDVGFKAGAALTTVDAGNIYCAPGSGTAGRKAKYYFSKYIVYQNLFYPRCPTPSKFLTGAGLTYPGNGNYMYAERGGNKNYFWRYDITSNTWQQLPDAPFKIGKGGGLAYGGDNYVYLLRGNNKTNFARYHIPDSSWETLPPIPVRVRAGGSLVWARGDTLYAMPGDGNDDFYRYVQTTGTWTPLTPLPVSVGAGGALAYYPPGNKIYAFVGMDGKRDSFYMYDIQWNTWTRKHHTPARQRNGARIAYCNYAIYGGLGMGTSKYLWRYSPPPETLLQKGDRKVEPIEEAARQSQPAVGAPDRSFSPGELLTYDPTDKYTPQYSPDGVWIAYTAYDSVRDCIALYRIPANGGLIQPLSSDSGSYEDPEWASSGSWLVAAGDDGLYKIAVGTPPLRLAQGMVSGPRVFGGDTWILYDRWDATAHTHQVRKVRWDGTNDVCLTPDANERMEPVPISGSAFACVKLKEDVYQLARDSAGVETWLTSGYNDNGGLDISPNHQWLTYTKLDESGFWQVYKMRVIGTEETRVTDGTCDCESPVFSPNGQYIAYTKWPVDSTGSSEFSQVCYKDVINPVAEVALNSADAERENPSWSPNCQYIIYEITSESGTLGPNPKKSKQIGRARTRIKSLTGVEEISGLPRAFALYQNRPNPFGRATTIRYAIPIPSYTELNIYDVTGRTVTRLVQSEQKPGYYSVAWKGKDMRGRSVAAGTYFYVLKSNGKIAQKRMLLVR